MEPDELLLKAWEAVQKAGLPESLHQLAFKEAVDLLRAGTSPSAKDGADGKSESGRKTKSPLGDASLSPEPDEDAFFSQLTSESGVPEADLRDILSLTSDGKVHVTPPTRNLGSSVAQQARTVVALVASARSKGLGEKRVNADAVREELDRKNCYQQNNFAHSHLGSMKGFNAGSNKSEILLTSKWVEDFKAAVATAHGRKRVADEN